jgi:hypothetical protein
LLANIYLHELDRYIEDELVPQYTCGKKRATNPEYQWLDSSIRRARKRGDRQAVQEFERQRRQIPSQNTYDPYYRRLNYVRYADDFLLGFIGSKAEAKSIKDAIDVFLRDRLHLEMNQEKTLITHARTQQARFLGYAISIYHVDHKRTCRGKTRHKMRSINGHVRLGIPERLIRQHAKSYQRKGKANCEARIMFYSDAHIIDTYQKRFRGLAEYYKYAADRHRLGALKHIMETALTKTLASKYRTRVSQIYRKYRGTLIVNGYEYKTLQVEIPTESGSRLIYWGAVPLNVVKPGAGFIGDEQWHDRRYERVDLVRRLRADKCELCGVEGKCEVHHVRKLVDLKKRWAGRRAKPEWVKRMIAIHRKTLIVCHQCYVNIHAGKPTPKTRPG